MTERPRRIEGGNHRPVRAPRRAPVAFGRVTALILGAAAAAGAALAAPAARPAARPANPESCAACFRASDSLACHQVAVELARGRAYERAIAIEEKVHAREPMNPEVAAALARMYHLGSGNSARAIALYHAALYASPGYPPALLGLGQIMEDAGELEISSRYFARGARERPDMALFRVRLAEVLIKAGRGGEAQPVLQEIVDRWPGSTEADAARKMMSHTALARP